MDSLIRSFSIPPPSTGIAIGTLPPPSLLPQKGSLISAGLGSRGVLEHERFIPWEETVEVFGEYRGLYSFLSSPHPVRGMRGGGGALIYCYLISYHSMWITSLNWNSWESLILNNIRYWDIASLGYQTWLHFDNKSSRNIIVRILTLINIGQITCENYGEKGVQNVETEEYRVSHPLCSMNFYRKDDKVDGGLL